ncbi:MAG: GNAT family N-acetyltransferase [Flavobacteriales bacterium]|nr:GNAT family N-acetyltransferase [Flavobacteriales bacterium]
MITLPIPSLFGLTTERLLFRHATLKDNAWWMEYHNSAEAIRFMPFTVGSESDCVQFIQWTLDRIPRDGSCLNAILERSTGSPVAMIGLLTQEVEGTTELEIGYHLVPSAWGRGYATEAAMACKEFAQKHALAPSVVSLIDAGNERSVAVAERNGMQFERLAIHRDEEVMLYRVGLR